MAKGTVISSARASDDLEERGGSDCGRAQIPSTFQPLLESKSAATSPRKPQPTITTLGKELRAS
jgi:hypothetical protein